MTNPEIRGPAGAELFHSGALTDPAEAEPPAEIRPQRFTAYADTALVYTGDVNGAQRWVAHDQSIVQYRVDAGTLTFHAWKRSHLLYWSLGASMTADGPHYDAADILSNYYMTLPDGPACEVVKVGHATDHDNSYCDEWQWGIHAQEPNRVASLCRAQWNDARFTDVVTAGSGCPNYQNYPWPTGYPTDWPPLPTGVQITPEEITMNVSGIGLNDFSTVEVANHDPEPISVNIHPSTRNLFSWMTGEYTVAAYSSLPIEIAFEGAPAAGTYNTTLQLTIGSASFEIPITAKVSSKGPPK
jgi:hypothetical protein